MFDRSSTSLPRGTEGSNPSSSRSESATKLASCIAAVKHRLLNHAADVRGLVLLSGYYFPTFRADVLASLATAAPVIGDLLSYTVAPLFGRALKSRVFRKLFAPVAVPSRFQVEFPTELSLRPSQLKASAADTVLMTPSAAALSSRYGELKMPIIIMAGTEDRIVNFASQSEHLDGVLGQSTLVSFPGGRPYDPSPCS